VVKNIRPLAAQKKGGPVFPADFFPGPMGRSPEPGADAPVDFAGHIFPKKGMQYL
jgi:hypothetical protein